MAAFFTILALLCWFVALVFFSGAKSAIHEGVAAIVFLAGVGAAGSAAVVAAVNRVLAQLQATAARDQADAPEGSTDSAPDDRLLFVRNNSEAPEFGPYHFKQIQSMWLAGQLTEAAEIRTENGTIWNPMSALSTKWRS